MTPARAIESTYFALQKAGERLRAAGFSDSSLAPTLGVSRLGSLRVANLPLYRRRLRDEPSLLSLVECLLLGQAVPVGSLERITGRQGLQALEQRGLISRDGAHVIPLVRITPFDGFLFAHDVDHDSEMASDHVTGIGPASQTLHSLTIRKPVGSALDIGTGCGVQALSLSRHAARVVATDVNPRALWLGQCNAALNGVTNIEWRKGSLLEPVVGEAFDLIVANPPFVVSPDAVLVFRDGTEGPGVCRQLVAGVPSVLNEGGICQMLINWGVQEDRNWEEQPSSWCAGTGCDTWLLHYQSEDPLAYAAKWNLWLRDSDPDGFERALDRWLAFYREQGIASVASGAIMLRRRAAPDNWLRADRMASGPEGSGGNQVWNMFRGQDSSNRLSDADLHGQLIRFAGKHRLEQRLRNDGSGYTVEMTSVVLDDGAGVAVEVDPVTLSTLLSVDGVRTLSELLEATLEEAGEDEISAVTTSVVATVRRLLEAGMIEVSADAEQ